MPRHSKGFRRIAVVNRGEPAMRLLNAVDEIRRAGGPEYRTIALFTEPDRHAWFVRSADESICLGLPSASGPDGRLISAYLDYPRLESALVSCAAEAAWVGWGFVAEHAEFARMCERLGITFVGPSADVIHRLANKIASKQLAESAGVAVIPWSGGQVEHLMDARAAAASLGYPVMLKAAAGRAGRGIHMVASPSELPAAFDAARAEAARELGDPAVFVERWIAGARHVEVQVLADANGTVWTPGVRDCTIQRRFQKVLEESASTALTPSQTDELRASAARIATAAGYTNAGTVEFLYDPAKPERAPGLLKVSARLQVEHAVTELTSGLDLVKLQLQIASGGLLPKVEPEASGHAIEVRLYAENTDRGFAPSPGEIAYLRLPAGPGIRVDAGVTEGDDLPEAFDSMIAKVVAWAPERSEALARLSRALSQTSAVVAGGATNKAFLLHLLEHPDVQAGRLHTGWLEEALARGDFVATRFADIALLAAATEAYEHEADNTRRRFLATASRGRPEMDSSVGYRIQFRYQSAEYDMHAAKIGDVTYRVRVLDRDVEVSASRVSAYERRLTCAGRAYRVLTVTDGRSFIVEVEGVSHTIVRDDGGIIRAPSPGVVASVNVKPGEQVSQGDTVAVLEMMKMELPVLAPFSGRVREVLAAINVQVDSRAPLVQLDTSGDSEPLGTAPRVDFAEVSAAGNLGGVGPGPVQATYDGLCAYALGYDLDAKDARGLFTAQAALGASGASDELRRRENDFLDLFTDIRDLSRREPSSAAEFGGGMLRDAATAGAAVAHSPEQYLYTFLRSPGRAAETVPARYRDRLESALARYGVPGLAWPSDPMEHALVRLYRSTLRVDALASAVMPILDRRLEHGSWLPGDEADLARERARLNALVFAAQSRYPGVADLASEIRFRWFDAPLLEEVYALRWAEVEETLTRLRADANRLDRALLISELVAAPQPLRPVLLDWYRRSEPGMRGAVLEAATRRYYRIRHLEHLQVLDKDGRQFCTAEFDANGGRTRLALAFADLDELPDLIDSTVRYLNSAAAGRAERQPAQGILDFHVWSAEPVATTDDAESLLRTRLTTAMRDRPRADCLDLQRLDITITPAASGGREAQTYHVTYLCTDEGLVEDRLHRNMHPMLAERLNLGRLSEFDIERLDSVEDVYLFRGVARANPRDERLFALAEVRDVTAVSDDRGEIVGLPLLERMFLQTLSAMRRHQAHRPSEKRLLHNQVILDVRPDWTLRQERWRELVYRHAPAASALGVSEVVMRLRIRDASGVVTPTELHVSTPPARGVVARLTPPQEEPIPPMSEYEWRVQQTQRRGAQYPYEIIRMLAPPVEATSDFPPGDFEEYDLDAQGRLVRVDRPYGENAANIVVGTLRNVTPAHPEGMLRVALLGDPSRSLGAVAEPECRRIIAALDLAERMQVPAEWFSVSSGALISMSSGTENMDWIAAVLRRIIEFTQAGGELNVIVTGINVGAQPYWNAEATMLAHTRGILVMLPESAMVLTGKTSLDFSGGVSAPDNLGIGGHERIMGPNGQAQYYAPTLRDACLLLLRHYAHTYVAPGERFPRRIPTADPATRDVRQSPHARIDGTSFTTVGEIFSADHNADRKKPFDIRSVMRAIGDAEAEPLERWEGWRNAETVVVWDSRIGGIPVCLMGIESQPLRRVGFVPADGPDSWTAGTLFPQSSRKAARAINAASGNRPLVVLANLSGFDGSPESMRTWQLEYGAEIGRAVTNFRGPIIFVVISRYHGGAFVVFSKALNDALEVAAVEGSYASVIGGAPAAAVVFARDVTKRTLSDPRVLDLTSAVAASTDTDPERLKLQARLRDVTGAVRSQKIGEVAAEFEAIHNIERALAVGSVDALIPAAGLRPYVIDALERGMAREQARVRP